MNILNNRNKRKSIFKALALCLFAAVSLTLVSCDDDMDIQQSYPFRLYYTAEGDEAHNFIVVVEDNFNNSYELEFDFNNRNVKDEEIIRVIPVGNFKPLSR